MSYRIISDEPLSIRYVPDQYKTHQKFSDSTLKFVPDWYVISKMIKYFLLIYTQMKVYSTLIKILLISYLIVMECVFLILDLIILTFTILIKMKMILILLFWSDFWLGILNLKNAKNLKKIKAKNLKNIYKRIINSNSVAS